MEYNTYETLLFIDYLFVKHCGRKPDVKIIDLICNFAKPNYKQYLDESQDKIGDLMGESEDLVSYHRKTDEIREQYPDVNKFCNKIEEKYQEEMENDSIKIGYNFNMGILATTRLLTNYVKYNYKEDIEIAKEDCEYFFCEYDSKSEDWNNAEEIFGTQLYGNDIDDNFVRKSDIEFANDEFPFLDT